MEAAKHYFWVFSNFYGWLLGRSWLAPVHHALINLSLHGLGYDNMAPGFLTGERWFISQVLRKSDPKVCIDVGANVGNYSRKLLEFLDAQVYAVEPAPSSIAELKKLEAEYPERFHIIQAAASDFDGTAPFFSTGPHSTTATLGKELLDATRRTEETVPVHRLDTLIEQEKLERVDFVKIDVEGYEREALRGMTRTIANLKPQFIQFEFNIFQLYRGYTVYDLAQLLPGYELFRLLPHGWIRIEPDEYLSNIYMFCNIVARRKQ